MEPIRTYLTKEGWSNELRKTKERHPHLTRLVGRVAEIAGDVLDDLTSPYAIESTIAESVGRKREPDVDDSWKRYHLPLF